MDQRGSNNYCIKRLRRNFFKSENASRCVASCFVLFELRYPALSCVTLRLIHLANCLHEAFCWKFVRIEPLFFSFNVICLYSAINHPNIKSTSPLPHGGDVNTDDK